MDEFTDLLISFSLQTGDQLLLCGDFNLSGKRAEMVDDDFLALHYQRNMKQFVDQSTRRSTSNTRENIFNLVIAPETSNLIASVWVVVWHHMSDHHLVCDLKLGWDSSGLEHQTCQQICICTAASRIVNFHRLSELQ